MDLNTILETEIMDTKYGISQKFEIIGLDVSFKNKTAQIYYHHHYLTLNGGIGFSKEKSFVVKNSEDIYYQEGEIMEDEQISDGTQIKIPGIAAFDSYATLLEVNTGILPVVKTNIELRENL